MSKQLAHTLSLARCDSRLEQGLPIVLGHERGSVLVQRGTQGSHIALPSSGKRRGVYVGRHAQ